MKHRIKGLTGLKDSQTIASLGAISRSQKNNRRIFVYVIRKSGTHNRRFAGHWRSDRKTSGCGWSERSYHLYEGANAAASVVKEIERAGGKAIAIQADAIDGDASKAAVEKTVATFGQLDVLVNNAGTAIPKAFEETTLEEMDRMIAINFRGTLRRRRRRR